jgi:threonylcarbamoyladenosine tRNA methylthiotransferase MtaB
MAGFHIENFGCRAARADGEAIGAGLRARGLTEAPVAEAGVIIVNTCSVTAEADRDARAYVRKANRQNPRAKVVVTGCYAQRAPKEVAAIEGVAAVIGNSHKAFTAEIALGLVIGDAMRTGARLIPAASLLTGDAPAPIWADNHFAHSWIEEAQVMPGLPPVLGHGGQTRPNLKIQEGCGNRCTFCIIPTTRGASRSMATDKVLAQVRGFAAAGGKELVLSGINLGRWGRDLRENRSFASLVRQILEETELPRLRLSSIEPMDWTDELIGSMREFSGNCLKSGAARGRLNAFRLARHAHLPLQSGSDAVLRRMHRRYRPWHYEEKVAALYEAVGPELGLGADVMVGFPGETDGEFRETYELIARVPFTYLHLFPFSARPGTRGWELHHENPVSTGAVSERMAALRALEEEKSNRFRCRFVGESLPAITLFSGPRTDARNCTPALTDNFLPVEIEGKFPANRLTHVRVLSKKPDGALTGEIDTSGRGTHWQAGTGGSAPIFTTFVS